MDDDIFFSSLLTGTTAATSNLLTTSSFNLAEKRISILLHTSVNYIVYYNIGG